MKIDIARLQKILDDATASGAECGCQLAIYQNGSLQCNLFSGYTSSSRDQRVTAETLFPVFSCGKGIMATAVHQLVEAGKLHYQDRLADYWPEFAANGKADIQLWQVLSHRTGLHQLPPLDNFDQQGDWEIMCQKMAASTPVIPPGTACNYQGVTFAWLIGETVRRATGKSLNDLIKAQIFAPLDLNSFYFGTTAEIDRNCAQVDTTNRPNSWCAQMFNSLPIRHGFVPSANGCGNALALARHYSSLITDTHGVRLLKPETLHNALQLCRYAQDPVRPGEWSKFGLGYALCGPAPDYNSMFGHGGALGAEGFAVPELKLAVSFTKNHDTPAHPNHEVRNQISAALGLPNRIW